MIGVALKGLAARKVRALLTAFAVVIGVSMVSGTFILTDTMQKSFDGLFTASYDQHRRRHPRQGDRQELHQRQRRHDPRVAADEGPGAARGRRRGRRRQPAGGQRRRHLSAATARRPPARASARASTPPARSFSPLQLKTGAWPHGPGEVVIDAGTRRQEALRGRRPGRHRDARQASTVPHVRHRVVRRRRLARPREHRGLGRQDRADAAAPRGPLRLDLDRGREGHARRPRVVRAVKPLARREPGGQGQRGAGGGRRRQTSTRGCAIITLLPARRSAPSRCSSARS